MGFFSKIRRKVSKFIPKEVKPFLPYIAAAIPGGPFAAQGIMGAYSGAGNAFLKASLARGASDEDASLKDALRTGAFAAAPQAINTGLGQFGEAYGTGSDNALNAMKGAKVGSSSVPFTERLANAATAGSESKYLNPDFSQSGNFGNTAKIVGAQGSIDMGIKAAELNEDALAKYNAEMAAQGINDKAGRRAAIRAIYANTGTWDMDEVDSMLDTYGYRTGGRVGFAEGDAVLTDPSMVDPARRNQIEGNQIAEQAFEEIMNKFNEKFPGIATGEETLEEMVAMLQAEDVMEYAPEMGILGLDRSMDMITPQSAGRSAQRIMRGDTRFGSPEFNMGGRVNYEEGGSVKYKHFQDMLETAKEGLASLEDDGEVMPIRELRLKEGGSVDDKLMERVKELQDEGLDFASAMAQAMKEDMASGKAMGGIMDVNMEETIDTPKGDMTMDENIKVADSTLMDAYKIYRFDMMEQGLEPMSLEEFTEQAIAESQMSSMEGSGRTMAASGGLMNLGGKEMDLRGGGFVPMGRAERADDVPARLSKNEFVMTADAVRAAGGGSVKKGADLMYDQMKQLERQA